MNILRSYSAGPERGGPIKGGKDMKYNVTIKQNIKYQETITGTFENLAVAQQFIEAVMKHFEEVSVTIEVETDEEPEG